MFKTGAQMMILVILAGLALMRESRQDAMAGWDNWWADFLAMNSRHGQTPAPISLVEIDASSLENHPWPWNPLDFSLFAQAILPQQPAVVAIDNVLDWNLVALPPAQTQKLPQYEKILRDNLLRIPKLVLGAKLGFPEDPQVAPKWQEVPLLRNVKGDMIYVPEFPIVEQQPSENYRLSATIGFTNLLPVRERYNSVPLIFRHQGQVIPAFPLQAVMMWAALTPDDVTVQLGSHIQVGKSLRIPIDERGRMRVDFGTPKQAFGFDELLLASEQSSTRTKPAIDLQRVKGTLVLLSRTDAEARTIPLASRRNGSPGELFAAAIATMQNQSFIRRAPLWAELLVLLGVALVSYRAPRATRWQATGLAFVTLAVYVLISMAIFNRWLIWMPGVMPFGAVLVFLIFRLGTPDAAGRPKKPVIL